MSVTGMAEFSVTQIPTIMEKKNWPVAAALLRRWFDGEPNSIPQKGLPCLDIVKMDWVLGFERAKTVYDSIFAEGLWKTPNAKREMLAVLRRRGLLIPRASTDYDRRMVDLPKTHPDHIQYVAVGGGKFEMAFSEIDHLTAALARFNFHIVALGGIEAIDGSLDKFAFTVVEIGVYVRDSYDFNDDADGDDQELGYWDPTSSSVGRTLLGGGTAVHNSDFRKWRDANKRGGDYLVFSDVKSTTLVKPERLVLGQ
jgi:hypothetical protein